MYIVWRYFNRKEARAYNLRYSTVFLRILSFESKILAVIPCLRNISSDLITQRILNFKDKVCSLTVLQLNGPTLALIWINFRSTSNFAPWTPWGHLRASSTCVKEAGWPGPTVPDESSQPWRRSSKTGGTRCALRRSRALPKFWGKSAFCGRGWTTCRACWNYLNCEIQLGVKTQNLSVKSAKRCGHRITGRQINIRDGRLTLLGNLADKSDLKHLSW